MQAINREIVSSAFEPIPCEIVFDKIFSNFSVKDIVFYAGTNRSHYKEIIENFKGLWDRTVAFNANEISHNPLLPLLKFIDGFQRSFSAIELFKKHKELFDPAYKPFGLSLTISQNYAIYQSLTLITLRDGNHFQTTECQVRDYLRQAVYLPHDIFRSRALIVLNFLAGFFGLLGGIFVSIFTNKLDRCTVLNFLDANIDKRYTNQTLLDTSFKVGAYTGRLTVLLILSLVLIHRIS